ncbi:MAG: sugar phosphate isomerase/epimerase [Lachnospiraceae bacterium]|jgi:sugar phosphate isomerase/epimerase|nr:sugar phosphate isomerase/epimerase [Lachnospiraceae bacterium]
MSEWKFALSTAFEAPETAPILLKGDICDNLRKAKKLGYQAVEIHLRENAVLDYIKIKEVMKETNVSIAQIITGRLCTEGGLTLVADTADTENAAVVGMKRYIDMASALNADIVLGWAKGRLLKGMTERQYYERLAKKLIVLDEYAIENNVKINIEVLNRYETDVLKTAHETAAFIREYHLDACRVHLDTFHMNIEEIDMTKAIKASKGLLGYFHLADATRWYPGSARLDFESILRTLSEIDYNGFLSVECLPHGNGEETAMKALEYLSKIA